MARGNRRQIALGPGFLHAGDVSVAEPATADLTTPWEEIDPGWRALGYTEEGSSFSYELSFDPVEVAEELDRLTSAETARNIAVAFALAQITAANLLVVFNGGTILTGAGAVEVQPPALGEVVRRKLGWEAEDHTERLVLRHCLQTGSIETARRKGSAKALLPATFTVETPDDEGPPFRWILASPLRG